MLIAHMRATFLSGVRSLFLAKKYKKKPRDILVQKTRLPIAKQTSAANFRTVNSPCTKATVKHGSLH